MEQDNASNPEQEQKPDHGDSIPVLPDKPNASQTRGISNADIAQKETALEKRLARGEFWMIIVSAAIAFFGLCSVVVGVLQWLTIGGQLEEMRSSSKQTDKIIAAAQTQAANTEKLAKAAIDQVEQLKGSVMAGQDNAKASGQIAENARRNIGMIQEHSRRDQRAWVGNIGIVPVDVNTKSTEISNVVVANSGRTPALEVSHVQMLNVSPTAIGCMIMKMPEMPRNSISVLQPNAQIILPFRAGRNLTQEQIDILHSGAQTVCLYGHITYKDIFGLPHMTKFCIRLHSSLKAGDACNIGNEVT